MDMREVPSREEKQPGSHGIETSGGRLTCQSGLEMEESCCLIYHLFLAEGERVYEGL